VTDLTSSLRNDGNTWILTLKWPCWPRNTVWYQALAQITQHQFAGMLDAITDNVK